MQLAGEIFSHSLLKMIPRVIAAVYHSLRRLFLHTFHRNIDIRLSYFVRRNDPVHVDSEAT